LSVILFSGWYSLELCQAHPDKLFVFGDNLLGFGMGGQAIIRNAPNAFGVPTKRKPAMTDSSFFADDSEEDMAAVLSALSRLWDTLAGGRTVVIPVTEKGEVSLGLERARLREFAPSIYAAICTHIEEMRNAYGSVEKTSTLPDVANTFG
jgi:hypothetical protein